MHQSQCKSKDKKYIEAMQRNIEYTKGKRLHSPNPLLQQEGEQSQGAVESSAVLPGAQK